MIMLHNLDTGEQLDSISDADLRILMDALEEESPDDRDYYIDEPTVELLEQRGASAQLVTMLRDAIGDSEGVEIRWDRS